MAQPPFRCFSSPVPAAACWVQVSVLLMLLLESGSVTAVRRGEKAQRCCSVKCVQQGCRNKRGKYGGWLWTSRRLKRDREVVKAWLFFFFFFQWKNLRVMSLMRLRRQCSSFSSSWADSLLCGCFCYLVLLKLTITTQHYRQWNNVANAVINQDFSLFICTSLPVFV